jgi:hypothetical protein
MENTVNRQNMEPQVVAAETPKKKREPSVTWRMITKLVDAGKITRPPAEYQLAPSRQGQRSEMFASHFHRVSAKYSKEPRRSRRKMARQLAKQQWKEKRGIVGAES